MSILSGALVPRDSLLEFIDFPLFEKTMLVVIKYAVWTLLANPLWKVLSEHEVVFA